MMVSWHLNPNVMVLNIRAVFISPTHIPIYVAQAMFHPIL